MTYGERERVRERKSAAWFYRDKIRIEPEWIADGGRGARTIRQGADFDVRRIWREKRRLAALAKVRRISPALAKTLRLILKNGANRRESIGTLARTPEAWHQAEVRYYRHRAILLGIFERTKDNGQGTKDLSLSNVFRPLSV